MKGWSCVLLINISRGAARIVPHPPQQLLRLGSCPAPKLRLHPKGELAGRAWSLSCPLPHRYSAHGIHPARIESLTHNPPLPRVSMSVAWKSPSHLAWSGSSQNSAADASASASAARYSSRRHPLPPASASVLYARRSGVQGVADRMLLGEKKNILVLMVSTSGSHVFMEHQVSKWGWGGFNNLQAHNPPERRFRNTHRSWYYCAVKDMYINQTDRYSLF